MHARRSGAGSARLLAIGASLWLCQCGTNSDAAASASVFDSASGSQEVPEIEPLGPATAADEWCSGRRTSLDDPGVRELARERDLELGRVLARASGEFESTLRWPMTGGRVSAAPESGDVPLTIRVSYDGGTATYVDVGGELDRGGTEISGCGDHVEVEVVVELRTEGGALNERFDALLFMQRRFGEIRYRAPRRALGGSLSLSPPPLEGSKQFVLGPELDYSLQVSELGTSGRLAVIVREFTDGEDTTLVPVDGLPLVAVAAWPAVNDCTGRDHVAQLDSPVDGVSPARIGELVAEQRVPFTWADGSETTLALSPRLGTTTGCAAEDRGLLHWWFDAEASPVTADGVVNGSLPASVHLVQYTDQVAAVFSMSGSRSRDELTALLPTTAAARDFDGGFIDFVVTQTFAWPSAQLLGSEGRLSVVVAPPPACDAEECDVRFTLAEGSIPASAAPRE